MARKTFRTDSAKPSGIADKSVLRFDTFRLDKAEKLPNGSLKIPARISRVGIQTYFDEKGAPVIEYRPPEEVFSRGTLDSFKGRTITDLHPTEAVTPANYRANTRGHLGDDIRQDGDFTAATVYVEDESLIKAIESGERKELSAGYDVVIDATPGTTPEGERFDRVQRMIRGNHVAIGPEGWGRAGGNVALRLDSKGNAVLGEKKPKQTRERVMEFTIRIDGVDYTFKASDESFKQALEKKLKADSEKIDSLTSDKSELQSKFDTISGEQEATKKALEDATDPARIDERVKTRAALEGDAKKIAPAVDFTGLSDRDVMIAALGKDYKSDDNSDDFIRGAFLAAVKGSEGSRNDGETTRNDSLDNARKAALDATKAGEPTSDLEKSLEVQFKRRKDAHKSPLALTNQVSK